MWFNFEIKRVNIYIHIYNFRKFNISFKKIKTVNASCLILLYESSHAFVKLTIHTLQWCYHMLSKYVSTCGIAKYSIVYAKSRARDV